MNDSKTVTELQSRIEILKEQRNGHMDKLHQLTDELARMRSDLSDMTRYRDEWKAIASKYREGAIVAQKEAERYRKLLGIVLDGFDNIRNEVDRGLK